MSDEEKTAALRWQWRTPTFASLMLGRIELAQIDKGSATGDWFWTLRFTEGGEMASYSSMTKEAAKRICEEHARKVLSMSKPESETAPEIRRNSDGTLDEIVASGCEFHLEQMSEGQWWMSIRSGGVDTHVTLYTKRSAAILANVIDHAG